MSTKRIGIERLNIYSGSMFLDLKDLASVRELHSEKEVEELLLYRRSVFPPWEDVVTLAANAALPILDEELIEQIGLFIVGTESSLDYGKSISSNLHEILGLRPNVRNFETKFACFSGVAAMDCATNWISSGLNRGRKALVLASDSSRAHLNTIQELVMGGIATAMVISDEPEIAEFELDLGGNWTSNIYDTYRPTATIEMGNNEVSLFSYLDALEGSFTEYCRLLGREVDFGEYFSKYVFHTPFAGMAYQAYRTLNRLMETGLKKAALNESFEQKVLPVLKISQQVGSCYASSNFAGIASAILECEDLKPGDRLGCFSYGSGAIGEFYSVKVLPGAREKLLKLRILERLNNRRQITVSQYEEAELCRAGYIEKSDFVPDRNLFADVYREYYEGKNLCVLKNSENFCRSYVRS